MNLRELNEAYDQILNEIFVADDVLSQEELEKIAIEVRGGKTNGTIGLKEWYINAEVIGKEGNDGSIASLCECLRDESLHAIADKIEAGSVEDIIELELMPNSLSDRFSVEATAKDFPELIKNIRGKFYWSVRFIIGVDEV